MQPLRPGLSPRAAGLGGDAVTDLRLDLASEVPGILPGTVLVLVREPDLDPDVVDWAKVAEMLKGLRE